jgi:adenine/guanine phosphoribosyltransferase-like PRPP-binding protein
MIVAFSGIRDLLISSDADVELTAIEAAIDADQLRFGGALGSDTVALAAVCGSEAELAVYVPFTVDKQPKEAREAIRSCADRVAELHLPWSRSAYLQRNEMMLRGADKLIAFTDGRTDGGTAWTIRKAQEMGLEVEIVPVRGEKTLAENPRLTFPKTGTPVHAWQPYTSTRVDNTSEEALRATKFIKTLKSGTHDEKEIAHYAERLAKYLVINAHITDFDAIVAVPRRVPGRPASLLPLIEYLASGIGVNIVTMNRVKSPTKGVVRRFRERFTAEQHAQTMSMSDPACRLLLIDDVLTEGGSMMGAIKVIERDAPRSTLVGALAVLYSLDAEEDRR